MRSPTRRWLAAILLAGMLAVLAACGPEDGRARGGGSGGDANNKPAVVVPKSKVFTSSQ